MSPPALAFSSANHAASLRSKELSLAGARDEPLVGCTRAFLALAALAIIYIEPSEPSRLVGLTYISLAAYCAWSLLQLHPRIGGSIGGSPWVDVAWATYLVALTQGTSSIFFFLYVFAILVASFSGGYRRGLQIAITSAILFTIVGLIAAPSGPEFELDRSLIRPIYLLTIGSMMAVWGGRAIARRERLVLLRDIAGDWKPRTGVSGTVLANLTRAASTAHANACWSRDPGARGRRPSTVLAQATGPPM
jgi:hypothetical protein